MESNFVREIKIDWEKIEQGNYVREIPALSELSHLIIHKNITFFVGENGTGKSTLLEAIAVAYGFNPEGGSRNYQFSTVETHSSLHHALRLVKGTKRPRYGYFLRAESFYNVASKAEDYRDGEDSAIYYERLGGKSLHQQSHGESFLAIMQNTFEENGFYILDEPEAALSPQRQLSLLIQLHKLAAAGAQFIIASHSPILLGIPGAEIYSFDEGEVNPVSYEETESYQVMEMYINHRDYLLKRLFNESTEEKKR